MQIPIERHALDNGLRVVLSPDASLPIVAVNLWYDVASRNERRGRTGLAHLFEHMMFQGSEHVPGTEHVGQVERVGGSVNGSTWLDRTNYYETVPANRLDLALWLESDRLGWFVPALTQEKLDNQRDVVKNERLQRVDNQPYGDWDERLQRMVFPEDHPYHHPVIGYMADLDAADLDDVRDFFRTYYAPNNAVLTICGDFDRDAALASVERWFGEIPRGPAVPPLPGRPDVEPTLGREVRDEVHGGVAVGRVYLAFRIPVYGTGDHYAADVAAEILAGGKSSRLYRTLVRERRLAQSVGAFTFPLVTGSAMLVVRGNAPQGGDVAALERALVEQIDELARSGPSDAEVERALTGVEARQMVSVQRLEERADLISMFTMHFDRPELVNEEIDRYRAVGADDVRRMARDFLHERNRAVLVYHADAADAATGTEGGAA